MLKTFPIDFIRQTLEQTLEEQHIANVNYFGGKDQVALTSFYEQLKSQEEVDRFVDNYRELSEQQNRTGLILNGVLVSPENPTITNLYSSLIIPMTFTCSMRVLLANRDQAIETINNLIEQLKGRKVDIAQLKCVDEINGGYCYKPFKVGTIGQSTSGLAFKDGDYIGWLATNDADYLAKTLVANLKSKGITFDFTNERYAYASAYNKLVSLKIYKGNETEVHISTTYNLLWEDGRNQIIFRFGIEGEYDYQYIEDIRVSFGFYSETDSVVIPMVIGTIEDIEYDNNETIITAKFILTRHDMEQIPSHIIQVTNEDDSIIVSEQISEKCDDFEENIIVPPEHESFEKYKLSLSFDAIRCDEPRNLNANEYCELTFSGSATLVSEGVALGNDLLKVSCKKVGIKAQTPITFATSTTHWLEPMEMPSGSNANTKINQLVSNNFLNNTHTDALSLSLQYTFIVDKKNDLLSQLFYYARYGTRGITVSDISPNMIFEIGELWCSWADFEYHKVKAKLVENVDIENTESDTLTIGLTLQIQGDND